MVRERLTKVIPGTEDILIGGVVTRVRFINEDTVHIFIVSESKKAMLRIEAKTKALLIQEWV